MSRKRKKVSNGDQVISEHMSTAKKKSKFGNANSDALQPKPNKADKNLRVGKLSKVVSESDVELASNVRKVLKPVDVKESTQEIQTIQSDEQKNTCSVDIPDKTNVSASNLNDLCPPKKTLLSNTIAELFSQDNDKPVVESRATDESTPLRQHVVSLKNQSNDSLEDSKHSPNNSNKKLKNENIQGSVSHTKKRNSVHESEFIKNESTAKRHAEKQRSVSSSSKQQHLGLTSEPRTERLDGVAASLAYTEKTRRKLNKHKIGQQITTRSPKKSSQKMQKPRNTNKVEKSSGPGTMSDVTTDVTEASTKVPGTDSLLSISIQDLEIPNSPSDSESKYESINENADNFIQTVDELLDKSKAMLISLCAGDQQHTRNIVNTVLIEKVDINTKQQQMLWDICNIIICTDKSDKLLRINTLKDNLIYIEDDEIKSAISKLVQQCN